MAMLTSQVKETFRELIADPNARFRRFFEYNCEFNFSTNFPIQRYFRCGKEMLRMGNIYFNEKNYFTAFVFYSRYTLLFIEKIKSHPEYKICNKADLAEAQKQLKEIVFPRAEKLKQYIKELFANEALAQNQKANESKNESVASDSTSFSTSSDRKDANFDSLKEKYNQENENEFQSLKQKELDAILNASKQYELDNQGEKMRPRVDRSTKPSDNKGNNYNLRTIYMPSDLSERFLDRAKTNTNKNIETCGILAGRLSQNVFVLSHCIIPKQSGTSDTCNTEDEHEIFEVVDQLNLITLGWIHTHPSQTAFLSSVDLHTQFGYQVMVPEAIAIVCAPRHNEVGVFILNPDYGMKEISECSDHGFHPHTKNPPVFEDCDHAKVDSNLKIEIIDLRFK